MDKVPEATLIQTPEPSSAAPVQFGNFIIRRPIGVGGMAAVFEAEMLGAQGFGKIVALKRVLPPLLSDPKFVASFISEARLGGFLSHHNIVQTLDFGRVGEDYYLAMEYVDGLTLRRFLLHRAQNHAPLPLGVALDIIRQICEGLAYAHTAKDRAGKPLQMIHRDLKPENVLLSKFGVAKIADFGISKATSNLIQTRTLGGIKGTFGYMSPEQALGIELDCRSDLYTVGVLLFELLTLERLVPKNLRAAAFATFRREHLGERLAVLRNAHPGLRLLLEQLLAFEASLRPESAQEVITLLDSLARNLPAAGPDLKAAIATAMAATPPHRSSSAIAPPTDPRQSNPGSHPAGCSHPSAESLSEGSLISGSLLQDVSEETGDSTSVTLRAEEQTEVTRRAEPGGAERTLAESRTHRFNLAESLHELRQGEDLGSSRTRSESSSCGVPELTLSKGHAETGSLVDRQRPFIEGTPPWPLSSIDALPSSRSKEEHGSPHQDGIHSSGPPQEQPIFPSTPRVRARPLPPLELLAHPSVRATHPSHPRVVVHTPDNLPGGLAPEGSVAPPRVVVPEAPQRHSSPAPSQRRVLLVLGMVMLLAVGFLGLWALRQNERPSPASGRLMPTVGAERLGPAGTMKADLSAPITPRPPSSQAGLAGGGVGLPPPPQEAHTPSSTLSAGGSPSEVSSPVRASGQPLSKGEARERTSASSRRSTGQADTEASSQSVPKQSSPVSPSPVDGFLCVNSKPYAYVTLDGVRLPEPTPVWQLPLRPGPHTLVFETSDGRVKGPLEITIEAGQTLKLRAVQFDP